MTKLTVWYLRIPNCQVKFRSTHERPTFILITLHDLFFPNNVMISNWVHKTTTTMTPMQLNSSTSSFKLLLCLLVQSLWWMCPICSFMKVWIIVIIILNGRYEHYKKASRFLHDYKHLFNLDIPFTPSPAFSSVLIHFPVTIAPQTDSSIVKTRTPSIS